LPFMSNIFCFIFFQNFNFWWISQPSCWNFHWNLIWTYFPILLFVWFFFEVIELKLYLVIFWHFNYLNFFGFSYYSVNFWSSHIPLLLYISWISALWFAHLLR
jgi:hypothetical protein